MTDVSQDFKSVLGEPESLHEDLKPYVEEIAIGKWVKHPLVYSHYHHPDYCAHINDMYKLKLAARDRLEGEGNLKSIITLLTERPYRLQALEDYEHQLSDEDYWRIVADIWTDSENIWQNHARWMEIFEGVEEEDRAYLMDEGEMLFFDKMPDTLHVYRGYNRDDRADGLSWTLGRNQAEFFSKYLLIEGTPRVIEGKVKKTDVVAFFNGRHEDEIVVYDPELVTDRKEYIV